jgi:hypothetical protein
LIKQNQNMKQYKFLLLSGAVCAYLATGCGGNSHTENEAAESAKADTSGAASEIAELKFSKLLADIPVGPDVLKGIQQTGKNYNKALLNPIENKDKYMSNYKKAINYGVYGADFMYITIYSELKDAGAYFLGLRDLAKGMGVEKVFDDLAKETAIEKVGINNDNISSFNNLVFDAMDKYLLSNKRLEIAVLSTTGAWMETQYITLNLVAGKAKNKENSLMYDKLWEQKLHIYNIKALLEEFKDNADFKALIPLFNDYAAMYDNIKKPEEITVDTVKALTAKMNTIRAEIVK